MHVNIKKPAHASLIMGWRTGIAMIKRGRETRFSS
jgi:hypothetical protein